MREQQSAVRFTRVSMQFSGVLANDNVTLDIHSGEVFALVGENGAGKSTLMNILYGLHTPTAGDVYVRGKRVERYSPAGAITMGVGMVHQHFMLVPSFTVAQNIVLSREPKRRGLLYDFKKAEETVHALVNEYGLSVDPGARVSQLGLGLQQRVEILKTLHRGADILILDEPTAVLTPQETDDLFAVIRRIVQEKGMTVILITHKLYEVMALSDRVGVMRGGRLVGLEETKNVNERMLASMMTGSEMPPGQFAREGSAGDTAVEVLGLQTLNDRGLPAVKGVSFSIRRGEILGVAGIEGNGQSELVEAIAGLRPLRGGEVRIRGQRINGLLPGEIRGLGLAHVPEDRRLTGASLQADVTDNLLAGRQREKRFAVGRIHRKRGAARQYAEKLFRAFDIRGAGVDAPAGSLSGGNLQKVVVAREFSFDAPVFLISQPTRGVDIGAARSIHQSIVDKRNAGAAVLLVSADLDEVFQLSDRIITMYEGRITGEFTAGSIEKAEIGYYMTGDRIARHHSGEEAL
ncbi:MAG: ABC transporter ATP-binding protein [Firmicutes bacterium]|nr:ABC transporter ATP-binding protein [Bacillota bacterium]